MRYLPFKVIASKTLIALVMALFLVGMGPFYVGQAYAADLIPRSLRLSSSVADADGVSYQLQFTYATSGTIGSVLIQFCQEGPLPDTPCTGPAGFDASAALLATQTGVIGFSTYAPGTTSNQITLTRAPGAVTGGGSSASAYTFINMENPSVEGALYVRISTHPSSDASDPSTDFGGLVLSINARPNVRAEVPQFLQFCVGESVTGLDCNTATEAFTDLGTLSSTITSAAQSQLIVGTNADNGYSTWAIGGTMTSGNNTIAAMNSGGPSAEGTAQFGLNLAANTDPIIGQNPTGPGAGSPSPLYANPNVFRYNSGDVLATSLVPDNYRKYTVSYIVNVPQNQPGGVYSTTLTYITLANF